MKKIAVAIAIIVGFSGSVQAQEVYYGVSISVIDYAEIGETATLNAITARLGTNFNENFSGEIRAGFGVGDDTVDFGIDVDIELDTMYGAYLRGGIPVNDSFFPYVVVGYTRGEVTASVGSESVSNSESDTSFGVGADFTISDNASINFEYMNYLDKNGAEIDGFSIGFTSRF